MFNFDMKLPFQTADVINVAFPCSSYASTLAATGTSCTENSNADAFNPWFEFFQSDGV